MSKNYDNLNALLGEGQEVKTSGILSAKGAKFTEAQLTAMEASAADLFAENATVKAAVRAQKKAERAVTTLSTAIDDALEAADVKYNDEATPEEKITALSAEIKRLGKQPGAMGTQTLIDDEDEDEADPIVDASAEHNKIAAKILKIKTLNEE